MKIREYNFDEKLIKKMKDKVSETKTDMKERGFPMCSDKTNDITAGKQCIGDKCSVYIPSECGNNKYIIGHFHTHPKKIGGLFPSANDTIGACKLGSMCIGDINDNIRCWIRKTKKHSDWIQDDCVLKAISAHNIENWLEENKTSKDYRKYRDEYEKDMQIIEKEHFDKHWISPTEEELKRIREKEWKKIQERDK